MNLSPMKKVTLVVERFLNKDIIRMLKDVGVTGYTTVASEGEGSRGVRASEFEGRDIRFETIVTPEMANEILKRIERDFLENFAVIAFVADVEVLRRGKFSGED